jgi:arginase
LRKVRLTDVTADASGAARSVVGGWARSFDRLLVHADLDALDYLDMPLAGDIQENRRNRGLRFDQLMEALRVFLHAPNWAALTIAELNPDHGESDGSTMRFFAESLADAFSHP